MDIKIGMPEILVVFAFVIYSQSFTFSAIAFCLGLLGRIFSYVLNYSIEMEKAKTLNQNIEDIGSAFKDVFSGKKD